MKREQGRAPGSRGRRGSRLARCPVDSGSMLNLAHRPAPPLDACVERLWAFGDVAPHARERILPSGTLELVVNLHEDELRIHDAARPERSARFSGAVVSGAYREPFLIDTRAHRSIVGVHFRPGGAFPFLRMPVHELAGRHVDLAELGGADARRLRERLLEAVTPDARLRVLEAALLERLARAAERRPAVSFALVQLERAAAGVRELAARVNLSHRRFIEVFEAEVGLTPKVFGRALRFQRALSRAQRAAAPRWAEIALACGYFDQAHLVRDFVAFAGLTPGAWARQRSERVKENHLPLPEPGSIPSKSRERG